MTSNTNQQNTTLPPRRGKRVSKEKALAYMKAYTTNGYNKTKAIMQTNPKLNYEVADKHTTQYHNAVVNSGHVKLSDITPDEVTRRFEETYQLARQAKDLSNMARVSEDLARCNGMFKDKQEITTKEFLSPSLTTPELKEKVSRIYNTLNEIKAQE